MARYRLTDRAADDLREIAAYIRRNRESAAPGVLAELRKVFRQIAQSPQIGSSCSHGRANLRMIMPSGSAKRYVVFFRYDTDIDVVDILSVLDGARDWENIVVGRDI